MFEGWVPAHAGSGTIVGAPSRRGAVLDRLRARGQERVPWHRAIPMLALLLLATVLPIATAVVEAVTAPAIPETSAGTDELSAAEQASIAAQIEAARLHFRVGLEPGTLHAVNADAGIAATVTAAAVEVVAADATGTPVRFETTAFGRAGTAVAPLPAAAVPVHTDTTATIDRGPLLEWFQNRVGGLQQGWTIADRPSGSGDLVLDLGISGASVDVVGDTLSLAPETGPALRYAGLTAFDSTGTTLPATFESTDVGVRITVDDTDADYPIVIDPVLSAVATLEGDAVAAHAQLGSALDMDGRWMAISAGGDRRSPTAGFEGAVYVYFDETGDGDWALVDRLFAPTPSTAVGAAVAVDAEPGGVTIVASQMGVTRVLVWTYAGDPDTVASTQDPVGPQLISATPWSGRNIGNYGFSLALENGTLVVGAPSSSTSGIFVPDGPDTNDLPDAFNEQVGTVEILTRSGAFGTPFAFSQRVNPPAGLQETDPAQRDIRQDFGWSVAIEGDLLAVGARGADLVRTPTGGTSPATAVDPGQSTFEGAVDVFRRNGSGQFQPRQRIVSDVRVPNMGLGMSVAFAGGDIVAGAPAANALGQVNGIPGLAYLFEQNVPAVTWSQTHRFEVDDPTTATNEAAEQGRFFGSAVGSTDGGRRIFVGARLQSSPGQNLEGTIYVYDRATTDPSSAPVFVRRLAPADAQNDGFTSRSFGATLAVSGDELVTSAASGSFGRGARSGAAYTFHDPASGTDPGTRLDPVGERWNANFGASMARDGDVLVVVAPGELRVIGNTAPRGAVYVFRRSADGSWQLEDTIGPTHGLAADDAGRFGPVDVWVERDGAGNDTGLAIAVGIPGDSRMDEDGRGDPKGNVLFGPDAGSVGVVGRSGGPGTAYDSFGTALWSGGNDAWGQAALGGAIYPGTITPGGRFGQSVAFADDGTLYVGEPGANGGVGSVHRFEPIPPQFNAPFRHRFAETVPGPEGGTGFGHAIAVDDDTLVVAGATASDATRLSVFADGGTSDELTPIRSFVSSVVDDGSSALSLDAHDDRIAVGSAASEEVRVYRSPGFGGAYELEAVLQDPSPSDARFGSSVALSRGSEVLSLAVGSVSVVAFDFGTVEVFAARVRANGSAVWSPTDELPPFGNSLGSPSYGSSLVHWPDDGGTLVGAPGWDQPAVDAGRVFSFDTSGVTPPAGPTAFVDVAEIGSVPAGATFIPTAGLAPSLLTNAEKTNGSIVAASIGDVDLSQPPAGTTLEASPLSSLPLSSLPLSSLDLQGAPLSSLPLSSLPLSSLPLSSLPGGWDAVLAGTPFEGVPLQHVVLADVIDLPQVQALTISQLGLSASPLSSLPLSSLVLGATPLSSLPIGDGDPVADWCDAVVGFGYEPSDLGLDCADPGNPTNEQVNLVSLGLAGVPLSSLPLSSLPLSSLPLSSLPLSSLPLSSLDIQGSPLSSLPLSSLPLSSLPLSSLPLSSLPLSSLPLSSLPLSSLPLSSLPLSSLPLSSLDIAGSPLSSLPLSSLPLSSLPLSSLPLSSLPLSSLPLSSLPLSSLELAGTPLSSLPLSSLDIAGTPLSSLPLSSLPLSSLPLSSLPLSSLPLSSLPLSSLPLSSLPLSSLELAGSPLSSLPLSSLANPTTGELRSAPLSSLPLSSLPLSSLGDIVDCDVFDCDRPGATLGDAARAGALDLGTTLGDLGAALSGIRLGDIAAVIEGFTVAEVRAALDGFFLSDLGGDYDDLTLGEVPVFHAYLTLGFVADDLSGVRLGDIADRIDGVSVADVLAMLVDSGLTAEVLTGFDDVTLGEVPELSALLQFADIVPGLSGFRLGDLVGIIAKPDGSRYSESELRQAVIDALGPDATLADLGDLDDLTLGELAQYGGTTLGELLTSLPADLLDGITLGDLLLSLIARTQYPWERLDLGRIVTQAIDAADRSIPLSVAFRADAPDGAARTVRVEVRPPFGSALVPGSVALSLPVPADQLEPDVVDGALVWTFTNVPAGAPHTLTLAVEATTRIGGAQVQATATLIEDDEFAIDRADLRVEEVLEPNDTPAQATALPEDTIVLSHVSTADDVDVFSFDVTVPGSRVTINLSNLDADLDAVLYSPRASSADIQEPSPRSIVPVEDEEASAIPSADDVAPEMVDDVTAPVELGDLAVTQASINRGTRDEQIDTGVLSRTGTYFLVVSGYNGATNRDPYALRLKRLDPVTQPPCPARQVDAAPSTATLPASLPAGTDTVFLVNRTRMSAIHGTAATDQVFAALGALVGFVNATAQDLLGVTAAVLPVDADAQVVAAYDAWDAQPCLVETANGVVAEIVRLLDGYRDAGTQLDHVVVVGGDDVVPFARVPDRTEIANESEYSNTFSDQGNALYATFASESVLTDDAYGDLDPYGFGDRVLFVNDTSVGRLVETPAEIADQLDDFVAADGLLDVGTGLVTGYDFLIDGADAVTDGLDGTYGNVDTSLVSDTWTRQDLEDAIAAIEPDVASINGHFDHYRALPGLGNSTGDESDLFTAAAVRGALSEDLAGAVVFSMGCHGGLTVSDVLYPGDRALDFAQAVSAQGGVFVGNTGYGYGDTELVALSERLMAYFAERLDGSLSIGEALLYAKAEYAGDLTAYGVYDEKAMMEATLYGLPFYRLDVADPPAPPTRPAALSTSPDPVSGIDTATVEIRPEHDERTGPDGEQYHVGIDPEDGDELVTAVHDRPVQPRSEIEFSAPDGTEAHDALVLGLTSTDEEGVEPYIFEPVVDDSRERTGASRSVSFPSSPVRINPQRTPAGEAFTLSATTGYFRTTAPDGTGIQRLYDEMVVSAHFADADSTDFTRPTFALVDATVVDGVLSVSVDATDDQGGADGVRRIYVLAVEEPTPGVPTAWRAMDLRRTPGTSRWTGSLAVADSDVEFVVQAVDASGNVGITSNKARNFRDVALPVDPPTTDLDVTVTGTQGQDGWYTGDVTLTATGGTGLTYEIVGRSPEQPYVGPVVLDADGHQVVIVRSADGQRSTTPVRIDRQGPSAVALVPADGAFLRQGSGLGARFSCPDAGSGAVSCTATLDGEPVVDGDDVTSEAGPHTLVVTTSADRAGNAPVVTTDRVDFSVVPDVDVTTVEVLSSSAASTTVRASFTGHPVGAPYSVDFAWDDGTTTTCSTASTTTGCTISIGADGNGTATATHSYGNTLTRTITATVTDRLGGADSGTVTINRTTAISATPVLVKVSLFGGVSLQAGAISATLTDEDGTPLTGRQITFRTLSGSSMCTATTDSAGKATCSGVSLSLAAVLSGGYRASFAGESGYQAISTTAPILVVG